KCRSVACANSRATVVLPVPGGPQNTSEPSVRVSRSRVSAPSGPRRGSWPTTSPSPVGRSLSASGRGASRSSPAAPHSPTPPRAGGGRPPPQHSPARRRARGRGGCPPARAALPGVAPGAGGLGAFGVVAGAQGAPPREAEPLRGRAVDALEDHHALGRGVEP